MKNLETTTSKSELDVETDQLLEAMRAAETVTVEFGTGTTPLFDVQDTVQYDANNLYVGVNVDPSQHALLAERIGEVDGYALLADFKGKSINLLPILDESVDRVFLGNVLGEPDSELIMEDFKDADGLYHGSSSLESKIRTLAEAVRLLKPSGELIILENNTPYIKQLNRQAGDQAFTGTAEIVQSLGLEIVQAVDQKDTSWQKSVRDYGQPDGWWSYWSYLVIAKKPEVGEHNSESDQDA